jgi:hypothetical protein
MSKRFTIGLLVFFAGVAGNLVAGWLQQGKWAIQPTTEQFLGTLASAGLILFVVALLESERALAWNWRWRRFWYLRELLDFICHGSAVVIIFLCIPKSVNL